MNPFFSNSSQKLELSPLQIALKNTSNKNLIPFTLGMPDNRLLKLISLDDFTSLPEMDLQYKPPSLHLKMMIKKLVEFQSIKCQENQIFLANGAQQAISLLLKLICDPGDSILAEEVTYPGLLQATQTQNLKVIPIKSSFKSGIDVISLENEILKAPIKPKLLYIVPNGHNPLSLSLSYQTRKEIIRIAQKYHLVILEDDPYGFLSYDEQIPSLQSIDPTLVAYVGTFSKILGPSFRCGWIICPPDWIEKLEILKEAMDLNTQTISQTLISHFLQKFSLDDHIITLQKSYKSKRDFLEQQLKYKIPDLDFIIPSHGFFIWGTFLKKIDVVHLFNKAITDYGVSFIPGPSFAAAKNSSQSIKNSLRLSFSFLPEDQLEMGVLRLKEAIDSL